MKMPGRRVCRRRPGIVLFFVKADAAQTRRRTDERFLPDAVAATQGSPKIGQFFVGGEKMSPGALPNCTAPP
jgi:hypothetical protein